MQHLLNYVAADIFLGMGVVQGFIQLPVRIFCNLANILLSVVIIGNNQIQMDNSWSILCSWSSFTFSNFAFCLMMHCLISLAV